MFGFGYIKNNCIFLGIAAAFATAVSLCGCSSDVNKFFDKKTIEIHTQDIQREISQIQENLDVNRPLPERYLEPPKVIKVGPADTKVYYFTKNHSPAILSSLVVEQLGRKVSSNPATNQLIIQCTDANEAAQTIDFLDRVDVPPIQVQIDCIISEMFADETMDWETTLIINDLLGTGNAGLRKVGDVFSGSSVSLSGEPAFRGASVRAADRAQTGLKVGVSSIGGSFSTVVDLLRSRGYLKILMNPSLRTVNGKTARIQSKDIVPVVEFAGTFNQDGTAQAVTTYKDVIDSLEVTPIVYSDGSIGLATKVVIGSKSTPEGVTQNTIITSREINVDENRIRPGDSLVIGGIRKSEQLGIVRDVPGLGSLPLIGVLFSSKDSETKVKEIMFILTPSISHTGSDYQQMIADMRRKHANPQYEKSFLQKLSDPFGKSAYTEHIERKATESEIERIKSELRLAEYEQQLKQAEKVMAEKQQTATEAMSQAERARIEAQSARLEAQKMQTEMEISRAEAEKARQEAQQAKIQAEQWAAASAAARAIAEKVHAEAELVRLQTQQLNLTPQQRELIEHAAGAAAEKARAENKTAAQQAQAAEEAAMAMVQKIQSEQQQQEQSPAAEPNTPQNQPADSNEPNTPADANS